MAEQIQADEREVRDAVQTIIDCLLGFDDATRGRVFRTAQTFFGFDAVPAGRRAIASTNEPGASPHLRDPSFSERMELPPREFLFQKQPKTAVDRVACLAYYLTHYRDMPHFKTIDISKLNTEAAQVKFSNAAYAVANATNARLLVSAGKGEKQLSAIGERYVEALPDRQAAKEVLAKMRPRRSRKKSGNSKK